MEEGGETGSVRHSEPPFDGDQKEVISLKEKNFGFYDR
jgi:hypothetical protein